MSRAALALVALTLLAACGAPMRVRTIDGEPDLVRISQGPIPHGFTASTNAELQRLSNACNAIDVEVGAQLPDVAPESDVTHWGLIDGQCEWLHAPNAAANPPPARRPTFTPELIVGILADHGGDGVLDQTASVIAGERTIAGVGGRARFDLQTRTLYVVERGRLWYLQLTGPGNGVTAPAILTTLGRALVQTPAATR